MPKSALRKGHRKREVWKKADGVCAHCGKAVNDALRTIDHVIPKSLGGTDDTRNLMPLCTKCNKRRSSDDIEPGSYYKYAHKWAIEEFEDYKINWMMNYSNAYGEITEKR